MASFFTYYLDAEVRATVVPASNCSQDWLKFLKKYYLGVPIFSFFKTKTATFELKHYIYAAHCENTAHCYIGPIFC